MLWQILLCGLCALWYFRRWRWLRLTSNIPTLPGTLPIIGVAHQVLGSSERLWKTVVTWSIDCTKQGGFTKVWIGPKLNVVVTDADLALSLMNCCLQKHYFYTFTKPLLGEGLLTSNVSTWKRHRKLLSPAFSQHIIDGFLTVFNQQSGLLVEAIKGKAGKGEFDPYQEISQQALETICQTAVGLPAGSNNAVSQDYQKALSKAFDIVFTRIKTIWLHSSFIYNYTFIKVEETEVLDILWKMSTKVIATVKTSKQTGSSNEMLQSNLNTNHRTKSFLNLLMELNDKGQISDTETREEIDTIIAAGYDTTATTLQILLVILGSYPEVQDRLYHEIKEFIPESSIHIYKEELSKLSYCEAVIKETLRLYPTVPYMARTAKETMKFGDFIVPDGTGILLSIYGVNRNEKYWGSDANDFKPERWLHPSTLPDHQAAFASFSLGRRNCIGKSYAMLSLKTSVAHILRQYRVTADHTKLTFKYEIVLKPTSGHFISIERR